MKLQEVLQNIRELIADIESSDEFYEATKNEVYSTQGDLEMAQIKMKYSKHHILTKSFELKRILRKLESHI